MEQEDSRLFQALYEDYLVPLKKLAASMGIGYDDIEDVVHDTLLSYYDKYPLDWSDKQKKAMLARILHSKRVDRFRKNSRYADVGVDNPDDEVIVISKLVEKDSLTSIVENETYREVRRIIEEMKKDWRDVIILYIVEERPIKEVCEILGISGTVCRSRIARARKYLKQKLKDAGIV